MIFTLLWFYLIIPAKPPQGFKVKATTEFLSTAISVFSSVSASAPSRQSVSVWSPPLKKSKLSSKLRPSPAFCWAAINQVFPFLRTNAASSAKRLDGSTFVSSQVDGSARINASLTCPSRFFGCSEIVRSDEVKITVFASICPIVAVFFLSGTVKQ